VRGFRIGIVCLSLSSKWLYADPCGAINHS
jgi:hypothetical protein